MNKARHSSCQPLVSLPRRRTGVKSPGSWSAAPRARLRRALPRAGARTPGGPGTVALASAGLGLASWCPAALGRPRSLYFADMVLARRAGCGVTAVVCACGDAVPT